MYKISYERYLSPKLLSFFFCWLILNPFLSNAQLSTLNCSIDSIVVINPQCHAQCTGSIQVYAQGAGQLFYQWTGVPGASDSIVTGLCAGTYSVIITDSTGCIATDSVTIEQPAPIEFNIFPVDATCPGGCSGSLSVVPFDTVSYSYQWPGYMSTTQSLNNLCQGTYTVILTDPQGCSVIGSAQVGYDPPFDLTFVANSASCLSSCDGSATVFANGIAPFTYQWSTGPIQNTQGAINLCSGSYTVSVGDSTGCIVTDTVEVPMVPQMVLNFTTSTPTCFGGCDGTAEVLVPPFGNYAYEWSTFPLQDSALATDLCSGTHYVQVTDLSSGCVTFDSVVVQDPTILLLAFSSVYSWCDNFCSGSATVNPVGAGPFTYLWQSGEVSQTNDSLCPGIYSVTVTDSLGCSTSASIGVASNELLFNVSDASCNTICDGVAEVLFPTASSWQATWFLNPVQNTAVASPLCAGNYSVTIVDSTGCQISANVDVNALQPVSAVLSYTPISCPGVCDGSIAASISGNDPFSLSWLTLPGVTSDSVFQLCSGVYPFSITDANGCVLTDSIEIPAPNLPQFTFSSIANSCVDSCDASAVITPVIPGTYTYEWQTTPLQYGAAVAGLCPEFTAVQITDADGCTFLDSVLIIGTSPIYIGLTGDDPLCFGTCDGFISSQVFGGTPGYTYEWSNGFLTPQILNVCEGYYMVTVTDLNGCISIDSITLNNPEQMAVSFVVTDASCAGCNDGMVSAVVTGGTPGYFYYWTPGGLGDVYVDSLSPGIYNLCVVDDNLCIECADATVSFFNAIPVVDGKSNEIMVFPNPFSTETTILLPKGQLNVDELEFKVFDMYGRNVGSIAVVSVNNSSKNISLSIHADLAASGMYLFKLSDKQGQMFTGRFMIRH